MCAPLVVASGGGAGLELRAADTGVEEGRGTKGEKDKGASRAPTRPLTPLPASHIHTQTRNNDADNTPKTITTGIGNVRDGLHPVQKALSESHGTQCGFCTPGFVMSMYALLRAKAEEEGQEEGGAARGGGGGTSDGANCSSGHEGGGGAVTEHEIEDALAGNLW